MAAATARLGSMKLECGLKLMPDVMSTAAPKSISFTLPRLVTRMLSCRRHSNSPFHTTVRCKLVYSPGESSSSMCDS